MKISLAAPVYNESKKIQEFVHRSVSVLHALSDDIEIILVDDCSQDNTIGKIREILPLYPCVKLIGLNRNSGQHISTALALKHTTGDYIFMMDSDLQVNPEYMADFFKQMVTTPALDIISAKRETRSSKLSRRIGSFAISYLLQKICKTKLKDIGSTFKLMTRKALDKIFANDILVQNLPILMMNLNLNVVEFPISYAHFQERRSHYKFTDLIFAITLALLNFTTGSSTLILLIGLGALLFILGMVTVCGTVVWGAMNHTPLPTNILVFGLILTLIGLQFILLGAIVFKMERINKNMDFRKSINQRLEYESGDIYSAHVAPTLRNSGREGGERS